MSRLAVFTSGWCILLAAAGCARDGDRDMLLTIERHRAELAGRQTEQPDRGGEFFFLFTETDDGQEQKAPLDWRIAPAADGSASKAPKREFRLRLDRYVRELPGSLWRDTKAVASNRFSVATLVAAGVAGLAVAGSGQDDRVAEHYAKRGGDLNKFWDGVGGFAGSPAIHLPIAGAAVVGSMAMGNELYQARSETLLNALAINGITTLALKGAFRTESPNGDPLGWPSGHSSSSFCFATVLHHQYGPWVGVPLLGFASFVAYQRVDARNHDLSDVISGSLIGIAIGHGVAAAGEAKLLGMTVIPYFDPSRELVGIALHKQW